MSKKYKLIFTSPYKEKALKIELSQSELYIYLASIFLLLSIFVTLIIFSKPIVQEYFKVQNINKQLSEQKAIIDNLSGTINELNLMKNYIESIIGTEKEVNIDDNLIRSVLVSNVPSNYPVEGVLSQRFDPSKKHLGIDIVNDVSTPIFSVADGVVIFSDFTKEIGNAIIIDHKNGYFSHYYHNEELFLEKNEKVSRGDLIAKLGGTGMASGPHLHLEIWKDGEAINPILLFPNFDEKDELNNERNNDE